MIDYSGYKFAKVEKKDKVAVLTLNRPETLNAIGTEEHLELGTIFQDLDDDEEVNAVIITGAGRAFSAGGDVNTMIEHFNNPSLRPSMAQVKRIVESLVALRKPIIAALNGDCTGLAATIALHCDMIYAVEKARIGDPHLRVGIVPGDGGCLIWPLQLSMCKAKEYLMTGDLVRAPEAERMGLINRVVPAEDLMEEAWKLAKGFADGPIEAISYTKVCLNKILQERINLLYDATVAYEYHSLHSEDHLEAAQAFLEKRAPQFKGKI